jgi:tetratricopeptide (TPR) repeat protein/predicted Ser/Thr protein kinase
MTDDSTKRRDPNLAERADTLVASPSTPNIHTVSDTMAPTDQMPDTRVSHARMPTGMQETGMLGRFNILDTLGAGGMGVVLAAYDPQLDRKVAIKVLRTRGLTGPRREKEAARLLREARSMAQLSHPHVVTVYEAGTIDDRVFIAMEYIPGETLRGWLADTKRSVAEIVDVYVKAGRGLAAGHHAGLIHRDFKPDNVLVGFDGRVRVIDFGLARPTRSQQVDTPSDDEPTSAGSPSNTQLTTVGTLFGTPLYMAPEQHRKAELDARADQFAFCVSLFEALYGRMPFPAHSYVELAEAVTAGKLEAPPADPDIPSRVVEAVLRGLRVDPAERFETMDMLLDALQPPVRRRRGLVITSTALGAGVAVAITLAVVRMTSSGQPAVIDPCTEQVVDVWDEPTKTRVRAAFLATKRIHAPDTFAHVDGELARHAATWLESKAQICKARATEMQTASQFEQRMRCLRDRREELRALTELFAKADAQTTDSAIAAARLLPGPDGCLTLAPGLLEPPNPVQAAQMDALEHDLATIHATFATGNYPVAAEKVQALLARARALAYAPYEAHALFTLGQSQAGASKPADAERTLYEALAIAARARNDGLIANIWTKLIFVIGHQLVRYNDALALRPAAETAIRRAEADLDSKQVAVLRIDLAYSLGTTYLDKGEYKLANGAFEEALKLSADAFGPDRPQAANIQNSIGGSLLRAGNIFAARKAFEQSLAILEQASGPHHPDLALPLGNLGAVAQAMGGYDEATTFHQRALAIVEDIHGPNHENVGLMVYSLAVSANGREDYKGAIPYYDRSLKIFEKMSPNHQYVGLSLIGLADCREEIGEAQQAVIDGERALEIVTASASRDEVQLAMARFILAKALWSANREHARARLLAAEARKGFAGAGLLALNGLAAVDEWFKRIDGKR